MISKHIASLSQSQSLAMAQRVQQLKQQNIDVISFTLGEPDFSTPAHIKQAAQQAIADDYSHYGPVKGIPSLRTAISQQLANRGVSYTADEVIVSVGAKQALCNTIISLVSPGEEVIIPTPSWVSYSEMVKIVGGTNILVPTDPATGYKITAQQLESVITDRSKLLILCSPNNPTGTIYTREELAALVAVLERHPHIYVIADEVYHAIAYGDHPCSLATFPQLADRLILIDGVSKAYAMTGYRIGWMACHNQRILSACTVLQGQYLTCACMVAQKAAEAALTGPQQCTEQMVNEYAHRRVVILDIISTIPDVSCVVPDGAFYIFLDVSKYYGKSYNGTTITNSDEMNNFLLDEGYVACVAGSAFGEDRCIRISYATSEECIVEGMHRIKNALAKLQ